MNSTPITPNNFYESDSARVQTNRLREYALEVVRDLTSRNYIAYFAGGCVRDEIMGSTPSDFDVATDATPEQVQKIFGSHRSLMIGEAFGVVCVHQRRDGIAFQVEVATFRSDGSYIDGRRPESVTFTSPQLDAQRRDFTINGIFFDPLNHTIIDFVQGQHDIASKTIRAIGDPFQRFAEDRLRLLRAIRFTSRFGFTLDDETWNAICQMADRIIEVSPERIAAEMRKMLSCSRGRCQTIELLQQSRLLQAILPEAASLLDQSEPIRRQSLDRINRLNSDRWIVSLVALLWNQIKTCEVDFVQLASSIKHRWNLSNDEEQEFCFVVSAQQWLLRADTSPWSRLQPLLLSQHIESALSLTEILLSESTCDTTTTTKAIGNLRTTLAQEMSIWNPPPLVTGRMLIDMKIPTGPDYAKLIQLGREAQLDGIIHNDQEARNWLQERIT